MKPSWIYSPKDETFELRGCWRRFFEKVAAADRESGNGIKKIQVLILRQLCRITVWLAVIGISSVITTCATVW